MTALVLLALPVAIASQPATQTDDVQAAVTLDDTLPAPSLSQRYQRLRRLEPASALVMGVSAVTFTATSIGLFNADYPGTALAAIVIGGGSTAGLYAVGLPSLWTTVSRATRRIRQEGVAVNRAPLARPWAPWPPRSWSWSRPSCRPRRSRPSPGLHRPRRRRARRRPGRRWPSPMRRTRR